MCASAEEGAVGADGGRGDGGHTAAARDDLSGQLLDRHRLVALAADQLCGRARREHMQIKE